MLRFKGGAKGMIWASQVAPGNENGLKLRVYGTKGGLEWTQEDPNYLWYTPFGEPKRLITRGGAGSNAAAGRVTRVPPGHPEGYLEGFANIYAEAARAIKAKRAGKKPDKDVLPGHRRWRRRHGLHRGLREIVGEEREVDEALRPCSPPRTLASSPGLSRRSFSRVQIKGCPGQARGMMKGGGHV